MKSEGAGLVTLHGRFLREPGGSVFTTCDFVLTDGDVQAEFRWSVDDNAWLCVRAIANPTSMGAFGVG
jgi:hypothetical protein